MRYSFIALLALVSSTALAEDAPEWYQQNITPHKAPGTVITSYTPAQPLQQPGSISPTQMPVQRNVVIQSTISNGNGTSQSSIVTGNGISQSVILNNSDHTDKNGHHHHRVCNYNTVNGVLVNNPNIVNSADCTPPSTLFIPLYANLPVSVPNGNVSYGINDSIRNDEFVIDSNRIIFTNLWHGTCHQSECSVTAGYMASNPMQGIVMMTQPALSKTPLMLTTPTATGPVSITAMDLANGQLTLQSQGGSFPVEDPQGNPAGDENGPQTVQAPGGATYMFDLWKAKFVNP